MALNNLAVLQFDTHRQAEAEPLYRRSLAIMESAHGSDHPTTQTIAENLAACVAALEAPEGP